MSIILAAMLVVKLPLIVRTYDSVSVSPRVLERAQQSADVTLAAVGIEPIWRPCHVNACITRPKPHELEIRLVKATALSAPGSLGAAAVDLGRRAGTLATIYVDRVDALAVQAGTDRGELLGRAIAHEIGHLILGTVDHAPHGLMRATWQVDELRRDRMIDWQFSGSEASRLRLRLAARIDGTPAIEAVMADAHLSAVLDDPMTVFKRAKRLEPGARVTVRISGAAPAERYFVRLDSTELIVLKLDAAALPKRRLLNMAIDHPDWMAATDRTIYKDDSVRIGPGGVFVKDRKVAELHDVVEHVARENIVSLDRR